MTRFVPSVPPEVSVLGPFVEAEVLGAGEVQVAAAVARLEPGVDPSVVLAVAIAARAPVLGHVGIELAMAPQRLHDRLEQAPEDLPWPDPGQWIAALEASAAVAEPDGHQHEPLRPLVWDGTRVYLHRYWSYELAVAHQVTTRLAGQPEPDGPDAPSPVDLGGLFAPVAEGTVDFQRRAAQIALTSPLSVIAGGPGTGKTRTVARLLAAAQRGAAGGRRLDVALAAPTGKAAARMSEALEAAIGEALGEEAISEELAASLSQIRASTIHALLGWRPGTRFRHDRTQPLPHDLVVIDETSMVSLPLMARLLDAVRPDARLVLVGDPDQLASVDAGTVMADLVGPSRGRSPSTIGSDGSPPPSPALLPEVGAQAQLFEPEDPGTTEAVQPVRSEPSPPTQPGGRQRLPDGRPGDSPRLDDKPQPGDLRPAGGGGPDTTGSAAEHHRDGTRTRALAGRVTVLDRVYRFGANSGIAALAEVIRNGDVDGARLLLDGSRPDLVWLPALAPADGAGGSGPATEIEREVFDAAVAVAEAALDGDLAAAAAAAQRVKVLAAVRHGVGGLYDWTQRIEQHVRRRLDGLDTRARWYVGRPVMVTANDRVNRLANGDTGIVIAGPTGPVVALGTELRTVPVARLADVETWWAMTIHKSQGSEFPHAVVSLPDATSPILTRQLLYTAVTRAKDRVTVVGSAEALQAAIERPIARASGLAPRLWPTRIETGRPVPGPAGAVRVRSALDA